MAHVWVIFPLLPDACHHSRTADLIPPPHTYIHTRTHAPDKQTNKNRPHMYGHALSWGRRTWGETAGEWKRATTARDGHPAVNHGGGCLLHSAPPSHHPHQNKVITAESQDVFTAFLSAAGIWWGTWGALPGSVQETASEKALLL